MKRIKKRSASKKNGLNFRALLIIGLLLLAMAFGKYAQDIKSKNNSVEYNFEPVKTFFQRSSAATPIPVDDVVYYARDSQDRVYLRYGDNVTTPDHFNTINQDEFLDSKAPGNLVWSPMIKTPIDVLLYHSKIFSFEKLNNPTSDFIFIMEWTSHHIEKEKSVGRYDLYIHKKDNSTEKLFTFTGDSLTNYIPRINKISLDGYYVSLNMYSCWYCEAGYPSTLLANLSTKKMQNIGQVSYFEWGNNGTYSYREYITEPCPSSTPEKYYPTNAVCPKDSAGFPLKHGQFNN